jgi:hypothetical protein
MRKPKRGTLDGMSKDVLMALDSCIKNLGEILDANTARLV